MPDITDVRRHGFISPATASENKGAIRTSRRGGQEERFHACLTVGQTIPQERQIAPIAILGRNRVVDVGIKGVVDGITLASTHPAILLGDRTSSAICQDQVESPEHFMEWVVR